MFDSTAVLAVFWVYLAGVVIPGPNFVAVVPLQLLIHGFVTSRRLPVRR